MASVPRLHDRADPVHIEGHPPNLLDPPTAAASPNAARIASNPATGSRPSSNRGRRRALCWLFDEGAGMSDRRIPRIRRQNALLTVRDLRTWFTLRKWGFLNAGTVHAVDGVTFDLARGESVAIVGESGCGKSTLARTLLGLDRPTEGEIVIEGEPLGTMDAAALRRLRATVGYVQQDPYGALPPFMNVAKSLAEPLRIHGISDAQERAAASAPRSRRSA
jgi:peptide/nickel transport system ATP-binding protein